jgi:MFS family permease
MVITYINTVRAFNRNVLLYLSATAMIALAVDGGIYSVIFNLYLLRLGFGPQFIGQVNAAGLLIFALTSLPAGALGGRWGSRRLMRIGITLIVTGVWLTSLAESIAPSNPGPWIMLASVIMYLGFAAYFANLAPFVIEVSAADEHNHIFAVQAALMAFAAFSGSLVGGFLPRFYTTAMGMTLTQPAPYRFPLICAALLLLPGVWAIWKMKPGGVTEVAQPLEGTPAPVASSRAWMGAGGSALTIVVVLSLVRFLQISSFATASTFFNVYMDTTLHVATVHIGIIAAMGRLLAMAVALTTPVLVARWGAPRTVVWSSWAAALCIVPLALAPVWQAAGLGFMGAMAFSSIRYPALLGYSMTLVPPRWRGAMSGAGEMSAGLSFAVMALVGGYMSVAQGYAAVFLLGALLTLIGTTLFWVLFGGARRKRLAASTV